MAARVSGQVTAFFLYDVAEAVDLAAVRQLVGATAKSPRLAVKPAVPAYVQYQDPPVQLEADVLGAVTPEGLQTRFKVYDYGVFSLSLTRAFSGTWVELHALAAGSEQREQTDVSLLNTGLVGRRLGAEQHPQHDAVLGIPVGKHHQHLVPHVRQ